VALTIYSHPFSSYCQKALMALWENDTPFAYRHLEEPGAGEELHKLWPIGRFPVLVDDGRTIVESSIIIEYLDQHYPGRIRFIPEDADAALEVRLMDRFFDQYVMTAMQQPVFAAIRGDAARKEEAMDQARKALDTAYAWLEQRITGRKWAAGDNLTMADCAAAPSLFYADWVHQIGDPYPRLRDYRAQLLAHPSFARAVEEGRPYRPNFPLGAPDRD
jgi:glutathione S-transferase